MFPEIPLKLAHSTDSLTNRMNTFLNEQHLLETSTILTALTGLQKNLTNALHKHYIGLLNGIGF